MRLDTMAATSMSGAAAAALAITAYTAIVGGNGLAYVVLFLLLGAQVAAACAVAMAGRHRGLEHLNSFTGGPALSCSLSLSLSPSQSYHPLNLTLLVLHLPLEGKTKGQKG